MSSPGSSFYASASHAESVSQIECEAQAKRLIDEGQAFLAYDFAQGALTRFPESLALRQVSALALIRTGALGEAKKILEPLCHLTHEDESTLRQRYRELRKIFTLAGPELLHDHPSQEVMDSLTTLLEEFSRATSAVHHASDPNEETLGLLARVYKDSWRRTGAKEEIRRSRDIYLRSFKTVGGCWTGINAATMSWLLGEHALSRTLAGQVLQQCGGGKPPHGDSDRYWQLATMGEASLLLGRADEAIDQYWQAVELAGNRYAQIVSSLQQLQLMAAHGFPIPAAIFDVLKPPNIVVFAGHMIDAPNRPTPRFPAHLEDAVRREIDRRLDALDARIGYCSAASGSDLLFIEAMQDRDAEVNIILPFAKEDFLRTSVQPAGPRWVSRFHRALKLASSVKYVTEEPLLNDTVLFQFLGKMLYGYAELRSRTLLTRPHLLAVWDGHPERIPGGTTDVVASWPDERRITVIPIDGIRAAASPGSPPDPDTHAAARAVAAALPEVAPPQGQRLIRAMLFADIVGYSQLQEERTPDFIYHFLERVARNLTPPIFANTWGDAIFAVMDNATAMVEYALRLQEVVCETDWADVGLPENMSVRIGLHAGPVFLGRDPITGRENYYGSHVNRAARIEPITIAGNIYASEQFVALLMLEQMTAAQEAKHHAEPYVPGFICDYIGTLSLAKGFASQALYYVRRLFAAEAAHRPLESAGLDVLVAGAATIPPA